MKKLLLSGITAVALMAAGTAQAGGLDLYGGTGLARTPLAMSLAPMQFQVAAEYVVSDDLFIPVRAAIGLPFGIEIGGAYWYIDPDVAGDEGENLDVKIPMYDLTAKWVLPKFVENLGLAVGAHYSGMEIQVDSQDYTIKNPGYDFYGVATYIIPMGNGLALIPSAGVWYQSRNLEIQADGVDQTQDGVKFFGSLLLKHAKFAVGGEYMTADDGPDGSDTIPFGLANDDGSVDGFYWVGGRFFVNPMITLQAGYINNADILDDGGDLSGGVFHAGVQFAFGGAK